MERLANNIAGKISSELKLDNDRKAVIAYGTFALIQTGLSILLLIAFGVIFGVAIHALVISFTASVLRKYSGGAHASTPGNCTIIGTFLCVGQALLISFVIRPVINLQCIIVLGLIILGWSYYIIFKLAPVDSLNKPINNQKKKMRMKKRSILILSVYLAIVMLFVFLYAFTSKGIFIDYILCIFGGIIWQSFTLTKGGHLLLGKIDALFDQVLTVIRRRA